MIMSQVSLTCMLVNRLVISKLVIKQFGRLRDCTNLAKVKESEIVYVFFVRGSRCRTKNLQGLYVGVLIGEC